MVTKFGDLLKVSYGQTGAPIERNYKQGLVMLVKISYYLFVCCISPSEKFWHHPSTRLILYYSYTDPLFPPLYSSSNGRNFTRLLYIFYGRGERYFVPKILFDIFYIFWYKIGKQKIEGTNFVNGVSVFRRTVGRIQKFFFSIKPYAPQGQSSLKNFSS